MGDSACRGRFQAQVHGMQSSGYAAAQAGGEEFQRICEKNTCIIQMYMITSTFVIYYLFPCSVQELQGQRP